MTFDHTSLIKHVEYLVTQDETELALKCLDMVPAYYRDHRVMELERLRHEILGRMLTVQDLMTDWRELPKDAGYAHEFCSQSLRAKILMVVLAKANADGVRPHVIDFGPGDFVIPAWLSANGMSFSYEPITVHKDAEKAAMENLMGHTVRDHGSPQWFVAFEIIEHLADPFEIRQMHDRHGYSEKVFLSTPKYTWGDGTLKWREEGIHHRRAYTPNEFVNTVSSLFPGRKWDLKMEQEMVMVSR